MEMRGGAFCIAAVAQVGDVLAGVHMAANADARGEGPLPGIEIVVGVRRVVVDVHVSIGPAVVIDDDEHVARQSPRIGPDVAHPTVHGRQEPLEPVAHEVVALVAATATTRGAEVLAEADRALHGKVDVAVLGDNGVAHLGLKGYGGGENEAGQGSANASGHSAKHRHRGPLP
jgi:hypothetical protein